MNLTEEIRELVLREGGDLFGVAPVERFAEAPAGHRPADILPGARAVVSFALNILESTLVTPVTRVYQMSYILCRQLSNTITYKLAKQIERRGFYAVMIPATIPVEMPTHKGLFGDFSHRHAAVAAGLGQLGRNTLLLTPQFGSRVWLGSVVTTAPLEATPMAEGLSPFCEGCSRCLEVCPVQALSAEGIDAARCARGGVHTQNLSGIVRQIKAVLAEPDAEKRLRIATGPETWEVYQSMVCGMMPSCNQCVLVCPAGVTLGA
ncbi:MAG: epoxyqueuosine reductase [Candidatus Tectomicrobia bacterium]|uniref:Epoxyqueuosine reductase n=1 Tax=Tectimicrobiota bacterium TaxID=2528274 RepID=A0A932G001_UNCTE|nr:epoxyqueuosine reductase [Candidatus Tectomicrobia bacterium]